MWLKKFSYAPLTGWGMTSLYCFVLISQTSNAGTLVGGTHTINDGDSVERWSLSQNATLNVESAETLNINASSSTMSLINWVNCSLYLFNWKYNLLRVFSPLSGAYRIPSTAPVAAPTTNAQKDFDDLLIIIYWLCRLILDLIFE